MRVKQRKASPISASFTNLRKSKRLFICRREHTPGKEEELSSQPHSVSLVCTAPALSPESALYVNRLNKNNSVCLNKNMSFSSLTQSLLPSSLLFLSSFFPSSFPSFTPFFLLFFLLSLFPSFLLTYLPSFFCKYSLEFRGAYSCFRQLSESYQFFKRKCFKGWCRDLHNDMLVNI